MTALADATHYWVASNYSSGSAWADTIGSLDATVVGSPTFDGDKFGLDGANDYFTVPDDADWDVAAGEAFSMVVVHTPADLASLQGVFDIEQLALTNPGWHLAILADGRHQFRIDDDLNNAALINHALGAAEGSRITVGFGLDRSNDQVWLYSPSDGTRRTSSAASTTDTNPGGNAAIGAASGGTVKYEGDIYAVAYFHNVELTNAEVTAIGAELISHGGLMLMGVG